MLPVLGARLGLLGIGHWHRVLAVCGGDFCGALPYPALTQRANEQILRVSLAVIVCVFCAGVGGGGPMLMTLGLIFALP